VILYPVCGFIVDKMRNQPIVIQLLQLSSALHFLSYIWLVLPPAWTRTPLPAVVSFATGLGCSQLLLVVIVPQLVPMKYVSTTLGAHKSLEQTGSVIMQTLAGLTLDTEPQRSSPGKAALEAPSRSGIPAIQRLLNTFLFLNVLHFLTLVALSYLDRRRKAALASAMSIHGYPDRMMPDVLGEHEPGTPESVDIDLPPSIREELLPSTASHEQTPLLSDTERSYFTENPAASNRRRQINIPKTKQVRRGELFAGLSAGLVVFAWVLFLVTAWLRLRSKAERGAVTTGIFRH